MSPLVGLVTLALLIQGSLSLRCYECLYDPGFGNIPQVNDPDCNAAIMDDNASDDLKVECESDEDACLYTATATKTSGGVEAMLYDRRCGRSGDPALLAKVAPSGTLAHGKRTCRASSPVEVVCVCFDDDCNAGAEDGDEDNEPEQESKKKSSSPQTAATATGIVVASLLLSVLAQ